MAISNAFPADRVARGLAIKTEYVAPVLSEAKGRPIKILVPCLAQESVSVAAEPYDYVSLADTATKFGRKSTAYAIAKMLHPQYGSGVGSISVTFMPLAVTGSPAQAAGTVTPTGSCTVAQTYYVKVNNQLSQAIEMTGASGGATVADFTAKATVAVNAILDMQVTATDGTTVLNLVVGYETDAGNFVHVEIVSPTGAEMTFVTVQPTGGAGTIDLDTIWAVFGDTWYSHVINGLGDATGSTVLDAASTFGELRWASTVHKPFKFYTGSNEATAATIRAITDARTTDRTNSIQWTPDSNDLPWAIAARMVAVRAAVNNEDPAQDAQLRKCDFLTVGAAAYQLDSDARQLAVADGLSTIEVIDDAVYISDSVMCYHAAGEDPPGYRYDVAIEKECKMINNFNTIFTKPADAGNPLLPDSSDTTNPNVRKPSYFKEQIDNMYDGEQQSGVVADAEFAKANTVVEISGTNPNRIDVSAVYELSGNNSVNSVNNQFTYYVG